MRNNTNVINRGRPLTTDPTRLPPPIITVQPPQPQQPFAAMATATAVADPSPTNSELLSPNDDFIPILHQPMPKLGSTPAKTPMLVIVPPPSPSDDSDGFTPVTPPTPSRTKGFKLARASHFLPRDALGIATTFTRKRSQRALGDYYDTDDDNDDREPLSPQYQEQYQAQTMEAQLAVKAKPKRRTLFGVVLEGWWDLGLLERGKSLRRKKTAAATVQKDGNDGV